MDSAAWLAGDPIVGVVDPDPDPDPDTDAIDTQSGRNAVGAIDAALADQPANASIATGTIDEVLATAPSLLITIGEAGLVAAAQTGTDVPVLPVGSVPGIETVSPDALDSTITAVLEGRATERERPLLGVDVTTGSASIDRELALFDVTLVTDEPARISEYSVESRGEDIAQFRADGVVVATPAGSYGYACAVDAPFLSTAIDAVAVAPIAPFVTTTRRWVLPEDELGLGVERDEGAICLLADDRRVGAISAGDAVSVGVVDTLSTLVVPDPQL